MSTKIDPILQDFGLKVIDFCMGARPNIPGVYDSDLEIKKARQRSRKRRMEPEPDPEPDPDPDPE
jgi:hypothetical protein